MKPFDIAEAFMEQRARGVPLPELQKAFEKSPQDLHPPGGLMASCSVVPVAGVIDRGAYQSVFTMACFMFDAMSQAVAREGCGAAIAWAGSNSMRTRI